MFVPKLQSRMGQAKNQISKQITKCMSIDKLPSRGLSERGGLNRKSGSEGNVILSGAADVLIRHVNAKSTKATKGLQIGAGGDSIESDPPGHSAILSYHSQGSSFVPEISDLEELMREVEELEKTEQQLVEMADERETTLLALAAERGAPMDLLNV
eukprot:comp16801_c0_seq1/m.15192 comp16801_c0_seq1/g.15192  ORF comp16801_c0_seq1/g.15192 comp16801_c0_seq1/m.15192 type:complete len:156 (-) comp16801_c0_seq1:54-521(-)